MNFKNVDFDLLYPDKREEGSTQIRQCQLVMIRMLKIVDYLCNHYQVKYFLTGGTLIGAIRHKGFIPWDDDLDISMPRASYEAFLRIAPSEIPANRPFHPEYVIESLGTLLNVFFAPTYGAV